MARRKIPVIADGLLDQLLAGRDPQAALGRDGLVDELKRALTERALNAEATIWTARRPKAGGTAATAMAARHCSPTAASCRSRCRATGWRPSIRS